MPGLSAGPTVSHSGGLRCTRPRAGGSLSSLSSLGSLCPRGPFLSARFRPKIPWSPTPGDVGVRLDHLGDGLARCELLGLCVDLVIMLSRLSRLLVLA